MEATFVPEPPAAALDEVIDTRRHLHAHPEVAFEEFETSRLIEARLSELGLMVHPCPTQTGAVASLETGRPGRTVMLRADIDGLPIQEESGVDFSSRIDGRMHACGHDAHTAIMLGVARTLAEHADALPGRYVFVFQPAEEIVSGAREMIARGLLERHPADHVIGLHVSSFNPEGAVVMRPGLLWAGADNFEVTFLGPGGHGGRMGRTGNVISAQAFLVERLSAVVEGLEHEQVACHITAGRITTDGLWNIVPRRAQIMGTLRTFTQQLRDQARDRLQDLVLETETEFAVRARLDFVHGTPPVINSPTVTDVVRAAARAVVGDAAVVAEKPLTVSDDMAEFLLRIPGCYFQLGARPEGETAPDHHSPFFRIAETALPIGVRVLTGAAVRLAAGQATS